MALGFWLLHALGNALVQSTGHDSSSHNWTLPSTFLKLPNSNEFLEGKLKEKDHLSNILSKVKILTEFRNPQINNLMLNP